MSPGMLFNIPPINNKWFNTDKTNYASVLIHSILFALIIYLVEKMNIFEYYESNGLNKNKKLGLNQNSSRDEDKDIENNSNKTNSDNNEDQYLYIIRN